MENENDIGLLIYLFIWLFWPLLLSGAISGVIAKSIKKRSFWGWFFYGFILPIISQIHALVVSQKKKHLQNDRKCEKCGHAIPIHANYCINCGHSSSSIIESQ